jgi:hypothetical protein
VLDRMIHWLAFTSPAVQLSAADLEASLYANRFRGIKVERPIFVTSLPRAGTTLFLELLTGVGGLATHCYRDMPFVLAPLLWDSMSRGFRKPTTLKERAHGDGMKVGYDSPEAFEEILWRTFWPDKFKSDGIELWTEDDLAKEFRDFFIAHIQKIIVLRSNGSPEHVRYVSKNNANVARLGLLRNLFPDCLLVIPFRNPLAQAMSLLRQHTGFLKRHGDDRFAKRYMNDIGHLEFGELHRPIRFDGVDEIVSKYAPDTVNYWMGYWVQAFRHILQFQNDVAFVSYERLCTGGAAALRAVEDRLGIPSGQLTDTAAGALRQPGSHAQRNAVDPELFNKSVALHNRLLSLSIV